MKMKQIKFLLAFAFANLAFAQHNTTAKLSVVNKDGLYEISLPNEIRSFSNRDLSDFRIIDSLGKEVPYFIREKSTRFETNEYVKFEIVSKTVTKQTNTSIVFKNPFKAIEEFVLSSANYSKSKRYQISGSNNLTEWFGVLNNGRLYNLQGLSGTSVDKAITFPRSNYKYLKIEFNDEYTLPINVLKIGGFTNVITNRVLQNVTIESLTTIELVKEKKTQIHIKFKNKEILNQVQFKITAPEFFNRKVTISKLDTRVIKKKEQLYYKQLASFQLNSEHDTVFNFPELFEDDIYIEIENKDSNNLSFGNITFFQKPLYAITYLKANQNYTVKTGNKTMEAPEYDLSFFRHNISENLPSTSITNVVKQEIIKVEEKEQSFWQQSWFMWTCIVITGFVILFFTSSLVKDLKKEQQ